MDVSLPNGTLIITYTATFGDLAVLALLVMLLGMRVVALVKGKA